MAKDEKTARELGLEEFAEQPSDEGLSLDQLEQAYIASLEAGDDPYAEPAPEEPSKSDAEDRPEGVDSADSSPDAPGATPSPPSVDEGESSLASAPPVEINPQNILEAMLFVGGEPVSAERVAGLMRGVRTDEIDDLVYELNEQYRRQGRPYTIVEQSGEYRLVLVPAYRRVAHRLYGSPVREVRLSQAAVEVLALVAYRQPLTRVEVDNLRGSNSAALLRQLVRRDLLSITRGLSGSREVFYYTTERFLELFGLSGLDELPRVQDMDRL